MKPIPTTSTVFAIGLASLFANAGEHGVPPEEGNVAELKNAYLECDRASMTRPLTSSEIMQCSVVYEELKKRAFGGDFDKLHAWSRSLQRAEPARERPDAMN